MESIVKSEPILLNRSHGRATVLDEFQNGVVSDFEGYEFRDHSLYSRLRDLGRVSGLDG